jgi:hypothetical protein
MCASLGRVSTVLKHSNAGMAYPNSSLKNPDQARERERERKEAKRKSAEFRGEEVGSQQDLGDEFPQHLRWSGRNARRFPVRACGIEEGGWGKEGGGGEGSSCFGFGETGPE